jgi:hypothetical protein
MSEHLLQWAPSLATLEPSQIGWGAVVAVLLAVSLSKAVKKSPNYPPGPPRDPILGNARQMTGDYIELRFTEWGNVTVCLIHSRLGLVNLTDDQRLDADTLIGDVNYLEVLGQPLVVLNSYTACKDLLEKRSAIYSSRPRFVLLSEL